jgi:hypothetical protein
MDTLHAVPRGKDDTETAVGRVLGYANENGDISLLDFLSNLVHFVSGREHFGVLQPTPSQIGNISSRSYAARCAPSPWILPC